MTFKPTWENRRGHNTCTYAAFHKAV